MHNKNNFQPTCIKLTFRSQIKWLKPASRTSHVEEWRRFGRKTATSFAPSSPTAWSLITFIARLTTASDLNRFCPTRLRSRSARTLCSASSTRFAIAYRKSLQCSISLRIIIICLSVDLIIFDLIKNLLSKTKLFKIKWEMIIVK